jgi:hypothetical protein
MAGGLVVCLSRLWGAKWQVYPLPHRKAKVGQVSFRYALGGGCQDFLHFYVDT